MHHPATFFHETNYSKRLYLSFLLETSDALKDTLWNCYFHYNCYCDAWVIIFIIIVLLILISTEMLTESWLPSSLICNIIRFLSLYIWILVRTKSYDINGVSEALSLTRFDRLWRTSKSLTWIVSLCSILRNASWKYYMCERKVKELASLEMLIKADLFIVTYLRWFVKITWNSPRPDIHIRWQIIMIKIFLQK